MTLTELRTLMARAFQQEAVWTAFWVNGLEDGYWIYANGRLECEPTHWRPLPPAPQTEAER